MEFFNFKKDHELFVNTAKEFDNNGFYKYMNENYLYYKKQCAKPRLKFNFAAFFLPLFWLVYRRLYKAAAVFFVYILSWDAFISYQEVVSQKYVIINRVFTCIYLLMCLFAGFMGNRIYLRKSCQEMNKGVVEEKSILQKDRKVMVALSIVLIYALSEMIHKIIYYIYSFLSDIIGS